MSLAVFHRWSPPGVLPALRECFTYGEGQDRATGQLYADPEQAWVPALATLGPALLGDLHRLLDVRFTIVAFQAYLNGSGCDWHRDTPFDAQAILSLGVSRSFGTRRIDAPDQPSWVTLDSGDLVFMPSGFQDKYEHCVPVEGVSGERCSLVFRTARR